MDAMDDRTQKSVEVKILGQTIRIKHESEEYIRDLERFINEKLEDIQNQQSASSIKLAARALLVLADEYFSAVKERESVEEAVNCRAKKMIELIEKKAVLS